MAYAWKLRPLAEDVKGHGLVLMRVYFENRLSMSGWNGLASDPHLDGSRALEDELLVARQLLCGTVDLGIPVATEFLDTLVWGYCVTRFPGRRLERARRSRKRIVSWWAAWACRCAEG